MWGGGGVGEDGEGCGLRGGWGVDGEVVEGCCLEGWGWRGGGVCGEELCGEGEEGQEGEEEDGWLNEHGWRCEWRLGREHRRIRGRWSRMSGWYVWSTVGTRRFRI